MMRILRNIYLKTFWWKLMIRNYDENFEKNWLKDILMKIDDEADLRPDPPSWRDLNTQMSGKNDNYEGGEHDNY